MTIEPARPEDLPSLVELQRLCYQREAKLYNDYSIPPLTQTLESLRQDLETQVILVAKIGGELAGSVRARLADCTCHIGRLIVHPRLQRQGLGSLLMDAIEERFGHADRFELFTGHKSEGNIRLYERLGYRIFRRDDDAPIPLIYLEKLGRAPAHPYGTPEVAQ